MNTEKIEGVVKGLEKGKVSFLRISGTHKRSLFSIAFVNKTIRLIKELEAEVERLHTVLECSEDVEILKSENAHLLDENAKLQDAYDKAQYDANAMREVLRCKND